MNTVKRSTSKKRRKRSNINYKYARRRKKWLRQNTPTIIALLILLIIIVIAFSLVMKLFKGNSGNKKNAKNEISDPVWYDYEEPVNDELVYIPPADVKFPYFIKVNRAMNCVTVYGIDDKGEYSIPVKAFASSCGRAGEETIVGENFTTTDKYEWRLMVDGTYGMYAFRINGGYLFHSVPYYSAKHDQLEDGQFNKLGDFASLGCVRMCVRDVKWLYDNCPAGTKVTIYDDTTTPGPLGKPDTIKIPEDSPYKGWDPTDKNAANPWNNYKATINGASDITVKLGEKVDLLEGVSATDTCGNDISDKIIIVGRYTFDVEGSYNIKYMVTDAIDSKDEVTITLTVTR